MEWWAINSATECGGKINIFVERGCRGLRSNYTTVFEIYIQKIFEFISLFQGRFLAAIHLLDMIDAMSVIIFWVGFGDIWNCKDD